MQSEKLILFPTTHEQSLPSFHVRGELADEFLKFLADAGVEVWEDPELVGDGRSDEGTYVEILLKEGTPLDKLEKLRSEFLKED